MRKPVIVAHSTVFGGAEAYLNRLYTSVSAGAHGIEPLLIGSIPFWNESGLSSVDVRLSPKWGRKTILGGLVALGKEKDRIATAAEQLGDPSFFHMQFKREQVGFTELLLPRGPVVWTEHGILPHGALGLALKRKYAQRAGGTSAIICVSYKVAETVAETVGGGVRIEVIENGVDTAWHTPAGVDAKAAARRALGLPEDRPVALWAGRMSPSKRPEMAISFADGWPGTVLIAGSGPEMSRVAALARSHANVVMVGHVDDMRPLYDAAQVFLFTSNGAGEGLPTVFLEAAAHALPVIASHDSGFGSMVDDMGGSTLMRDAPIANWQHTAEEHVRVGPSSQARSWAEDRGLTGWVAKHHALFDSITR